MNFLTSQRIIKHGSKALILAMGMTLLSHYAFDLLTFLKLFSVLVVVFFLMDWFSRTPETFSCVPQSVYNSKRISECPAQIPTCDRNVEEIYGMDAQVSKNGYQLFPGSYSTLVVVPRFGQRAPVPMDDFVLQDRSDAERDESVSASKK